MGKNSCCVCKKDIGLFSGKTILKDGSVCNKCLKTSGIPPFPNSRHFTSDHIERIINARANAIKNYCATHKYDQIEIDTNTRSFKADGILFLFDNLTSYSFHEDPVNPQNQDSKNHGAAIGGIVGGIRGGFIGGAVGAAVGGAVGSLFSSTCNSMSVSIAFKDFPMTDLHISFITESTKISSAAYKQALNKARSCLEGLRHIERENVSYHSKKSSEIHSTKSSESQNVFIQNAHFTAKQLAEELDIYKALLYNGDISEEEYNEKKKQLLALK